MGQICLRESDTARHSAYKCIAKPGWQLARIAGSLTRPPTPKIEHNDTPSSSSSTDSRLGNPESIFLKLQRTKATNGTSTINVAVEATRSDQLSETRKHPFAISWYLAPVYVFFRRPTHVSWEVRQCKGGLWTSSQVNGACRTSEICTPVMSVDRIFLVHIDFEEPVVGRALVVLVPAPVFVVVSEGAYSRNSASECLRVELLEVRVDQVCLSDLDELVLLAMSRDKVSLGLQGPIVDLADELDSILVSRPGLLKACIVHGGWGCLPWECGPSHEGGELGLVLKVPGAVWRKITAAEEGAHDGSREGSADKYQRVRRVGTCKHR